MRRLSRRPTPERQPQAWEPIPDALRHPAGSGLRTGAQAIVHEPVQRPTLVLNPPGDGAFVEFATHALNGGVIDPAELQRRLRERFPHSIVRPRGLSGERTEIWYVYRDGRWIRS